MEFSQEIVTRVLQPCISPSCTFGGSNGVFPKKVTLVPHPYAVEDINRVLALPALLVAPMEFFQNKQLWYPIHMLSRMEVVEVFQNSRQQEKKTRISSLVLSSLVLATNSLFCPINKTTGKLYAPSQFIISSCRKTRFQILDNSIWADDVHGEADGEADDDS